MADVQGLSELERTVLDHIDEAALVAHLVDLVRVPSITGTSAESDLQDLSARHLDQLGFDLDVWSLDLEALRADPEFPGSEAPRSEGVGVVATTPGGGTPALVLQGHVDVVPIGDLDKWEGSDPFSALIRGRVLHGRGACDMKAGLAANVAVARALAAARVQLERPLALHCVVSEEDGGLGAFATLRRGHTGDAAVLTEPTTGRIVTANAGALTFRVEIDGLAAHGSARLSGVSAFDAFVPVNAALRELEAVRNRDPDPLFADNPLPYGLSIGTVHCGDWASSVPDKLTAEGRLGVRLDEDPAEARRQFEHAVADAASRDPWLRDHPPTVTWSGGQFASGRLDPSEPLIGEMGRSVADVTAGPVPAVAAGPYGSDLRLYLGIGGIPTLHYGPGDVLMAHAPREQVGLDEVLRVTQALVVLAMRRCGAHR